MRPTLLLLPALLLAVHAHKDGARDDKGDHDDHDDHRGGRKGREQCRGKGRHHGKHGDRESDNEALKEYKDDVINRETDWDTRGVEGPSSAESAELMVACLLAANATDVQAKECEVEYAWLTETIDCEHHRPGPGPTIVIGSLGGVCLLLLLYTCHLRRKLRKQTALGLPVSGYAPGALPGKKPTTV